MHVPKCSYSDILDRLKDNEIGVVVKTLVNFFSTTSQGPRCCYACSIFWFSSAPQLHSNSYLTLNQNCSLQQLT